MASPGRRRTGPGCPSEVRLAVTQVETWVHWFLAGSGPKLTDDDWLGVSPYSQMVISTPCSGVSGRRDDLGIDAEALTGARRKGHVLVDAPTDGRGADDPEAVALVGAGDQLVGHLDPEERVVRCPPALGDVAVETAVVHEGLVDVDGVDTEPRHLRDVVELDPDLRMRPGRCHAGRDMGPLVRVRERPEAHRRGPICRLAEQPKGHMTSCPGVPSRSDDFGVGTQAVAGAGRKGDVLVDAPTEG